MISFIQDLAVLLLDRVLGVDPEDNLDALEQSTSPQLRRLGAVLSTLEMPVQVPPPVSRPVLVEKPRPALSARALLAQTPPSFDLQSSESAVPPVEERSMEERPVEKPPLEKRLVEEAIAAPSRPQVAVPQPAPPSPPPSPAPSRSSLSSSPNLPSPHPSPHQPIDAFVLPALADLNGLVVAWQVEVRSLQQQRQEICAEGPAFGGWLEAEQGADGTAQYRLCSIHESGRLLSEPCPLVQVGEIRKAIARYHRQQHLLSRQQQLQGRLDMLTAILQGLAHQVRS
ncbi:MAG: hypothetical protein EA367_19845 [Leptolyngbya sp. DLM2.Bin15]|nr:MAG: hypothetical protein EA367_19845 [Leptolyngbya sp. DLM2.Bin15]